MTQIARPELSDEELKAKWSRPRAEIEADLARNPPAPNSALQAAQELPSVRICPDCQAHGVRKVQYGYRVMDEVCDRCEGDGYLKPPKPEADDDDDDAAKVAQIEDLIANASSLDELDRLEAALKSRDYDSVLAPPPPLEEAGTVV